MTKHLISILAVLLLTACGGPTVSAPQPENTVMDNQATQAAYMVQTEIARPTRTLTPSPTLPPTQTPLPPSATPLAAATPSLLAMRATAQPGTALYTDPDILFYVFQIDPAVWEKDPRGQSSHLVHKAIAGCSIVNVLPHGIGAPRHLYWQDWGRFRWQVMDYGAYAYAVPALPALEPDPGVPELQTTFLDLQGYNKKACRSAQEEMLSNVMTRPQAYDGVSLAPFLSPTPRPGLANFECPDTPPARLRIGDQVAVVTNGLWLRSEPRADDSTKLRQYLRYAPVTIKVVGGPECEKFVYWQVKIDEFGEGGSTIQGWLAEGDLQEYYIAPVK